MSESVIALTFDGGNTRLDKWLANTLPDLSRSQAKALVNAGRVEAAGQLLKPNTLLDDGTPLVVMLPEVKPTVLEGQNIPLDILYEDDQIVAVNKAPGMVVHPSVGHGQNTLVNALIYRYPDMASLDSERPGIVHRLDMDTSGVIITARTSLALQNLQQQFEARTVHKVYLCLVHGQPTTPIGLVDVPIGRHPQQRQRMAAVPSGKPARTQFKVLDTFNNFSLLELVLETGRTHQIRVHMAWLGVPVVGDTTYGRRKSDHIPRQLLHANILKIDHPISAQRLSIEAPLPADFENVLEELRA